MANVAPWIVVLANCSSLAGLVNKLTDINTITLMAPAIMALCVNGFRYWLSMHGIKVGAPSFIRALFHMKRQDTTVEAATQASTPAVVMRFQDTPRKKIAAKGIIIYD